MANSHTNFWLELLRFGKDEKERRNNWNIYCLHNQLLSSSPSPLQEKLNDIGRNFDLTLYGDLVDSLKILAANNNGPLELPKLGRLDIESFMDFSDIKIDDNIFFSGRILIGADFRNSEFEHKANFSNAYFLGLTHFDKAKFRLEIRDGLSDGISFRSTEFHNTVYFNSTEFMFRTRFDGAKFYSAAYFRDAIFGPERKTGKSPAGFLSFKNCQFQSETDFTGAKFDYGVGFEDSEFHDTTKFDGARIQRAINFTNAKFRNTTSFRNSAFGEPPKFYEAVLHEDTDFSNVDFRGAEKTYFRPWRCGKDTDSIKMYAGAAVRAWDRLALIMSQREKLAERHEFFRLKMRAQRIRDGRCLLSMANWLFDKTSDYGWSISRAFTWWAGHIVIGMFLMLFTSISDSSGIHVWLQALRDSFFLSFANAHAILGLASIDGYLYGARENMYANALSASYLDLVGTLQIVFGPFFLFLVLLTLRNRFRIG